MIISIIGSGNMAHGIGTRIATSDHDLTIFDRDLSEAQELAKKLGENVKAEELGLKEFGEIVIFALPYAAIPEVIDTYAENLQGKILVDISNPVDFETFQLIPPVGSSGAEEIAKNTPEGATIVKAFNTTFAGTLVQGEVEGKKLDVLIATDSNDAGEKLVQLCNDSGLRGIHVGPLSKARVLEEMQLMQMSLQEQLGTNWMSTIKILP